MLTIPLIAPFVLIALVWVGAVVVLGRMVVPPAERVALRCWRLKNVRAAAAIGRREISVVVGHAHQRTTGARI